MVEKSINDRELLRRIGRKDEDALALLYERYSSRLYSYALRILGDPQTAEDVLQESLLAVWQSAKRFRGDGRVKAWLFTIVHNKAMKTFRRKEHNSLDAMQSELPSTETGPDENAYTADRGESLRSGIKQLSPDHQRVLDLVFFEGMSMKETAQICGVPVGTIKSRLNAAKAQLKGKLNFQYESLEDI